jgi:hypothetical protein
VSGPTTPSISITEPGQPCVMISGSAFSCRDLDVDEVDAEPVDLGRELRQRVQFRLALAPVVVGRPVARQLLQHRQLHALRPIADQLLVRPARRRDARTQRLDLRLGNLDRERPDRRGTC